MPGSNNGGNNGGNNNGRNNGNGGPPSRWGLIGGLLGVALLFNIMASNDQGDNITPNQPGTDPAATEQQQGPAQSGIIPYTEFKDFLNEGEVEEVLRQRKGGGDQIIQFTLEDGRTLQTWDANEADLLDEIQDAGASFKQLETEQPSFLASILPFLIFPAVFVGLMMWMRGGMGMGIGKSKAKIKMEGDVPTRFDDVAGIDSVKEDLEEMVEFLKAPEKFQKLGARMPTGALMVGPPGTGKTLIARAIAGESGVPFITTSGSEFVEMYVGNGAARVRDLFENAKKHAPCIIFIDEIDAVGRERGTGMGGGHDEREQTLNQLLVEMDGFEENPGIIVLAATNRPDVLDPALKRPGRFDRQVQVNVPDLISRKKILEVHMRKSPMADNISSLKIAQGTPGFSGAELANLVNEAALHAARAGKEVVDMHDFEMAKDKIIMGAERESLIMTDEERKLTAYHEAGHALLSYLQRDSMDPIHKATIIPRGGALGMVVSLPERDKVSVKRKELIARIAMAYGGTAAEELTFGGPDEVTTGASGDIQQATKIARAMVTQYGFSDRLGKVQYEGNEQQVFIGRTVSQQKHISESTAQIIDEEVKRLTDEGYEHAKAEIANNWDDFERLAETLLEYETLTGHEIGRVMRGEGVGRNIDEAPGANDPVPADPEIANDNNDDQRPNGPVATPGPGPAGM